MDAEDRRLRIWCLLCTSKEMKIAELADHFHVSQRTIRTDIDCLSRYHPIITVRGRYHGGMKICDPDFQNFKPLTREQFVFLVRLSESLCDDDKQCMNEIIHVLAP